MEFKTEWLQACFSSDAPRKTIFVTFRGRNDWPEYSAGMLELMKTDPDVMAISDGQTGEIIYTR